MKQLKPHPLAAKWPRRDGEAFDALKASIELIGQQRPIVVLGNQIVDGIERERACRELGKEVKLEKYKGDTSDLGILQSIIAYNSDRGINQSQKAILAAESAPHFAEMVAERKQQIGREVALASRHGREAKKPEPLGETRSIVARLYGVSDRLVTDAKLILESDTGLAAQVKSGKIKLSQAKSQLRHKRNHKQIRRLKLEANISLKDLDLRHGDNVKVMQSLRSLSVDCVFADPPYNCGWVYRCDPGRDRLPDDKYLAICRTWIDECARVLAANGNLFVLIDDNYSDQMGMLLRGAGLIRRRTIVWWEEFGVYVTSEAKLSPACRFIHHYCKSNAAKFNNVELRERSKRQDMQDVRANPNGRTPSNVWPISRVQGNNAERVPFQNKGDAPQLPVAVPERCILLATEPGDLVLDPFNGHGITGIAALRNQRRYIGIDRDKVGLEQSEKWIKSQLAGGNRD